ncbi:MAG TPA: type III-A CRISPR-associated RAMP protein Csm5, partial [Thermoplasmata archaeon]|nr:type III-A CRISPR-associated RAMP protein Csm5 [Thermoplasmata archaeon]
MRFEIETVTPLHVGSGSTYPLATEAVVDQNRLRRVSISKLSDLSENDRRKLERALKKLERASELKNREASRAVKEASRAVKEIGEVLKEGEFRYEAELKFKIDPVRMGGDKIRLTEIRECIKMADVPFIPGSSIKGAIRTALLWKYARENRDELHEYLGGKVEEIRRKMEKIRREVNKKEKWKIKEYKKVIKEYKKE